MSEPKEPTAKQWKRRALHAEAQVGIMQRTRSIEHGREMSSSRELAAYRVALTEAQEAIEWALAQQPWP